MTQDPKKSLTQATDSILESISDGVFTVDHQWKISSFNRAAEKITGIDRQEAIGKFCWEVFRSDMCERNCPLSTTLSDGKPVIDRSGFIIDKDGQRIPISVSTALLKDENDNILGGVETFRDLSEVEELRKELKEGFQVGDLVSRSKSMFKIFKILPRVAASDSTVLIEGETGTGKELLARAIHHLSSRNKKPFVSINCGALPDTLLESELFGYKSGAFTDATKDKPGQFTMAQDGTLFLDEIGDTSSALQVRLLRVIQEREFVPLGGTHPEKVNVRIIAATNKNLSDQVQKGLFREDLYYRINVVRMELPPLRDRKEDIPLLIEHFIQKFNVLHNRSVKYMDQKALALLMSYDFPGNIRELENIMEYIFVLCTEEWIHREHLPEYISGLAMQESNAGNLESTVQTIEAQTILETLKKNNYNKIKTAQDLGMHKSTLYRKMKKYEISLARPSNEQTKS
jgi:PAS domain S-box-containing protein